MEGASVRETVAMEACNLVWSSVEVGNTCRRRLVLRLQLQEVAGHLTDLVAPETSEELQEKKKHNVSEA